MKKVFYKATELLLVFGLAAFFGWLYEIACVYVWLGRYFDRGVLHLPLCPIYGFGILMLMGIFNRRKNIFLLFFGSALIATAVELAASYVLEYCFHTELWTYEEWAFNFQGRISAVSSALFGLLATLFLTLVRPPVGKLFHSKLRLPAALFTVALACFCVVWELRFLL